MYQEYFQFTGLPFPSAPDAKVYYSNPVYQAALDTLGHGVLNQKGLMVLSGATGIGKTALLKKLFDDLGATSKPIWFASGSIVFGSVAKTVLTELGGAPGADECSSLTDNLRSVLLHQKKTGVTCCLIFEDAQDLDAKRLDELRQLDNLTADGRNLLPMILVGQPALLKKLSEPENYPFKQRVAVSSRLYILARSEVERYVNFQLEAVGHRGRELFDAGAVDRVAYYSGGIPRLVNNLCDNALLAAYRNAMSRISVDLIDAVALQMGLSSTGAANFPEWRTKGLLLPASFPREPTRRDDGAERISPQARLPIMPRGRWMKTLSVACLSLLAVGSASLAVYSGAATSNGNRSVVDAVAVDSRTPKVSPRMQAHAQHGGTGDVVLPSASVSTEKSPTEPPRKFTKIRPVY